jgi:hypothetical protein
MTDIVEKLTFWTTIYPEDMEKSEGNLYLEAREEILRLRSVVKVNSEVEELQKAIKEGLRMLVIQSRGKGDKYYDRLTELAYKEYK